MYTDCAIFSPDVPVIRNALGQLLEEPRYCSVVTTPAPNHSARGENETEELKDRMDRALRRRIYRSLAVFAERNCTHLVLGAFGCGVFGNDPKKVAKIFEELLNGEFKGKFVSVVFAVFSRSRKDDRNIEAFQRLFQSSV